MPWVILRVPWVKKRNISTSSDVLIFLFFNTSDLSQLNGFDFVNQEFIQLHITRRLLPSLILTIDGFKFKHYNAVVSLKCFYQIC